MAKLYNLAQMTTATTGTGTITLGAAVSGFLSFAAAGVQDGEKVTYAISDGANSEIGRGVYTSSGTTLTRSVLKSTNSDAAISLSGTAKVFITAAAEDVLYPQPHVQISSVSNQAIANSSWVAVNFGTVDLDQTGAGTDLGTHPTRIIVPAGYSYARVRGFCAWASSSSVNRFSQIQKNGTVIGIAMQPAVFETGMQNQTRWVPVTAGDYFELFVNQSSGSSLNLAGSAAFGGPCWLEMTLMV